MDDDTQDRRGALFARWEALSDAERCYVTGWVIAANEGEFAKALDHAEAARL